MDYMDFFFPEQAQANHLRKIAANTQRETFRSARDQNALRDDIDSLARENDELRMYLSAITQTLAEKGLIKPEEIQQKISFMLPMRRTTKIEEDVRANSQDDSVDDKLIASLKLE